VGVNRRAVVVSAGMLEAWGEGNGEGALGEMDRGEVDF
jgi:hypothetical protein